MSTTDTPPAPAPPPLSTAASDFSIDTAERTLRSSVDDYFARIRGGELGSLPAILGFVVLFILFSITADNFLTARNFANLLTQATPVILIAIGLTLVLLLGEIDLSAGATAGVCAVYMASWLNKGVNPWIAIPGSVLIGVAIGLLTGWLVAVGGHSLVRRHARLLPLVAGRRVDRCEGGRHDRRHEQRDPRHRHEEHEAGPRLGAVGDRRGRVSGERHLATSDSAHVSASRASRSD